MEQKKFIIRKVSVSDTLRNIPCGTSVKYDARELAAFCTAQGIVSRLNKSVKYKAYSITTDDNGVTYTITHNEK